MASAIIHLAVAKELEKKLFVKKEKEYLLGSIAPDISKQINETKTKSHFLYTKEEDIPNIKMFTDKYPNFKDNEFLLGYFIHLYTDKLWCENFIPKICENSSIKLLDGTIINTNKQEQIKLIYSDYTNINQSVIETYNMDLSLFYEEFPLPNVKMTEIPVDKLNILIEKMGLIIENSKTEKHYIFDIYSVNDFIENSIIQIEEALKKY